MFSCKFKSYQDSLIVPYF
jgi:hypothetical protein